MMSVTAMELRCDEGRILHGKLLDNGLVEVKCRSRFCGATRGLVVLHRFNLDTGELVETQVFKNPTTREGTDGARK
jgi:hypothetical protein